MRYLLFLIPLIAFSQNNGIRSLNGSLGNSQRIVWDTVANASFSITTSNGVHSLNFPSRLLTGGGSTFYWNKSGSAQQTDSIRFIAGSNVSLVQSGNTLSISSSGGSGGTYQLIDTIQSINLKLGDVDAAGSHSHIELDDGTATASFNNYSAIFMDGANITSANWTGTSIDTAYTNAVSKITGGYGITATKNAKDYTIKADSSVLATKSGNIFSGSQYIASGNLIVSAGYVDSDSTLDDGTTWRTSVAYHAGLGGSTFGNISTGTITSNGNSITGGAGSFTTGTFSGTITQNGNATGNMVINNSTGSPIVTNVYSTSATTQPQIQFNRARGTSNTSYNAVNSGDVLGGMFASGSVNTTTFSGSVGAVRVLAKENFSTTANGTYLDFATTQNGATSRTVDMVLDKDNSLPRLTVGTTAGTGTGNLYIDSLYFGTTLAIDANRKHTNVGGIATTGAHGVAPIVDTVTYTSMSSGMSKNLTSTAGMYRLLYTIFCTTADAAAGSVQLTLSFNNGAAQTMTSAAVNLTSTANKDDDVFVFYVASGTPSISTAITGSAGTSKYSVHAVVERLK